MKLEGCKTRSKHLFVGSGKKDGKGSNSTGEEIVETVRYVDFNLHYSLNSNNSRHDFYQTPTTVIASFFLKKINKDAASVKFTKQGISLDLPTTDSPPKRYKNEVELVSPINPEESTFKIMGTKLEVVLVKADGSSWPVLRADERRTGEIIQVGKAGRAT